MGRVDVSINSSQSSREGREGSAELRRGCDAQRCALRNHLCEVLGIVGQQSVGFAGHGRQEHIRLVSDPTPIQYGQTALVGVVTSRLGHQPDAHQPYYILREHVIDRIYDQNVGYWEANLQGLAPSRMDRTELLVDYLGLSEAEIVKAADRLAADGRYAMAAELTESAETKFPGSTSAKCAKRGGDAMRHGMAGLRAR